MFAKASTRRSRPTSRPGLEVLEGRVVLTVLTPLFHSAAALTGLASYSPAEIGTPHFSAWHGSGYSFDAGSARLSAAAPAGSAYGRALLAFDPVAFASPNSILHFDVADLAEQGDTTLTLSFVPVRAGNDGTRVEDLAARQTLQSWKLTPDPAPQADAAVEVPLNASAPSTVGSVQVELATVGQASVQLSNFRLDPASVSAAFTTDPTPAEKEAVKTPAADPAPASTPPAHDGQPVESVSGSGQALARNDEAITSNSNTPAAAVSPNVLALASLGSPASAAVYGPTSPATPVELASSPPSATVPASAEGPVILTNAVRFTAGGSNRTSSDADEKANVSRQAATDQPGPHQNLGPTPQAQPGQPKDTQAPASADDGPPAAPPPEVPIPPLETASPALWPVASVLAGLFAFRPARIAVERRRLRLRA